MPIELVYHFLPQEKETQVLRFWSTLTPEEQQQLISQIEKIDFNLLQLQKQLLQASPSRYSPIEPFMDFSFSGQTDNFLAGKQLIREGRMGCLVLAGGQGTRLRVDGPKGRFPVSLIKKKSLFQLCAEKVLAAGKQAGRPLALAVMTSPENDAITKGFFAENQFFGLDPAQVSFFCQGMLPLLDAQGHLFLESRNRIAEGPYGNGKALHDFFQSGIWQKWSQQGIRYVNTVLIDNPLADPFDAELLGFHAGQNADVTLKCTEKGKPQEKVGVVVKENGHCSVIEYSELSEEDKHALQPNGRLKYCCASLSLFCFSMDFIQRLAAEQTPLPLHKAWKAAKFVNEEGVTQLSATPIAWKFEMFIFDVLRYANKVSALLFPREEIFAPLKNYTGEDSIETVQQALLKRDRQILRAITGEEPPSTPFELAADFYYPTPELIARWKGRVPTTSYVEADNP
ncbi:UTP--glucose-1-phosphate uridylyltransferase [Candidatus Protochlamydia phocaeensis]|uniref:UTP--glucose-1-phosphate uridylyltransferase n=1 Tax=Candidatus Protochlamydia phocaeensis TaxID=1414722 RepID=UPI000837F6BC|nr:UTP--glucose-1-phosphate uridylyltransferase [Candidatus Protochlamydia phocaeensis]